MVKIVDYKFDKDTAELIKKQHFGTNWPLVYIINNDTEAYVGETINISNRTKQHLDNPSRKYLQEIHVINDESFNKSATLDIESSLIELMSADTKFKLQNGNGGLQNHRYYEMDKFSKESNKFKGLWHQLKKRQLVDKELIEIQNSDLFKYSPYKALTIEQISLRDSILLDIEEAFENNEKRVIFVEGEAGTGKTVLATYLMKLLNDHSQIEINDEIESYYVNTLAKISKLYPELKVGYVVPMTSLRKTMKMVFSNVKNLKPSMCIGPNEIANNDYDILIVDESHRLSRRKNITGYKAFDDVNRKLGLDLNSNQLDWVLKCSKVCILFYDSLQSIKPSDVDISAFNRIFKEKVTSSYSLNSQLRCLAGDDYLKYIDDILNSRDVNKTQFKDFEFKLFGDFKQMDQAIKEKDNEFGLSRIVAGFAWEWISKRNPLLYDIELDGLKKKWNQENREWIHAENSINEIGCIHTVQGYDLNYVGVIIGKDLVYRDHKIRANINNYYDTKGKMATDKDIVEKMIINIYRTLMARGIKGCYVYVVDEALKQHLSNYIDH